MTFWRPLGLCLRGRARWGELSMRWGAGAYFKIGFGSSIFRFLVDFGWFWEAKMVPKIDFWEVFSMLLSSAILASIFGGFLEARNLKNSNFASTGARFLQNWRVRKMFEKSLNLVWFLEPKTTKNQLRSRSKLCVFYDIVFLVFFFGF